MEKESISEDSSLCWTRCTSSMPSGPSPSARCAHSLCAIGRTRKIFLFGGWNGSRMLNDLHELNISIDLQPDDLDQGTSNSINQDGIVIGIGWSKPITTGEKPWKRAGHTMTSVEASHKMFLFGGGDGNNYLNDLYSLDGETMEWKREYTVGTSPAARSRHTTMRMSPKIQHGISVRGSKNNVPISGDRLVVFGGGDDTRVYNDVYVLDTTAMEWSKPKVKGVPPIARWGHSAVSTGDRMIIFGGHSGAKMLDDVHVLTTLDPKVNSGFEFEWQQLHPTISASVPLPPSPSPPRHHGPENPPGQSSPAVLDSRLARAGHISALLAPDLMLVFGGGDGTIILNDCWILDLSDMTWEYAYASHPPAGRCAHVAILMDQSVDNKDSVLLLHGGGDGTRRYKDLHFLDFSRLIAKKKKPEIRTSSEDTTLLRSTSGNLANSNSVSNHPSLEPQDPLLFPYLHSIGLAHLAQRFQEQRVDFHLLPHLTEDHLIAMGIDKIGDRLRCLTAFQHLRQVSSSHLHDSQTATLSTDLTSNHSVEEVIAQVSRSLEDALKMLHAFRSLPQQVSTTGKDLQKADSSDSEKSWK